MKFLIPLFIILSSCGLYIDNSNEYSYRELLNYGLNRINRDDPKPLIVTGEKKINSYIVMDSLDMSLWSFKESISFNTITIESYVSKSSPSLYLKPLY